MTTRLLVLAATTSFLIIGCGSAPSNTNSAPITDGLLCQFHLGTTSIHDVTELLGAPTSSGTTESIYYLLYDYPGPDGASVTLAFAFQGGYLQQIIRKAGTAPQVDGLPSCNGASALGRTS